MGVALKVIQRQNSNFVINGFAGTTVAIAGDRVGFVWELDNATGNIMWQYAYESPIPGSLASDYDVAKKVVEIQQEFNHGPEYSLVITGGFNRIFGAGASTRQEDGTFYSCLRNSTANTVFEQWRTNAQIGSGAGYYSAGTITYHVNQNRLFGAAYSELGHSLFISEIRLSDGVILHEIVGPNLILSDMILDGNDLVLSGIEDDFNIGMTKITIPNPTDLFWDTRQSIIRIYKSTEISKTIGAPFNMHFNRFTKPQNILVAPNGGYMIMNQVNLTANGNAPVIGTRSIGIIAHQVDERLVSACGRQANIELGFLANDLYFPIINDVATLSITNSKPTATTAYRDITCSRLSCQPFDSNILLIDSAIQRGLVTPTSITGSIINFDNTTLNITGVWSLNPNNAYQFTNGTVLNMSPGAELIVPNGTDVNFVKIMAQGDRNQCMWRSITLEDGSNVTINKSIFRDAQYALELRDGASIKKMIDNNFVNNFVGLYIPPNPNKNNIYIGNFEGNTFESDSSGLIPPFVGLVPTPTLTDTTTTVSSVAPLAGLKGLAGIYGWDVTLLSLSWQKSRPNIMPPVTTNLFQNLTTGITLFNSNMRVLYCNFVDINPEPIYGTNLAYQGCGIHGRADGYARLFEFHVGSCAFEDNFIGLSLIEMGTRSDYNVMNNISNMGVRSLNLFDGAIHVFDSEFTNMQHLGVGVFNPSRPSDVGVLRNTISMHPDYEQGAAVLINDAPYSGTDLSSTFGIASNTIHTNNIENGMVVINHDNGSSNTSGQITNNTIHLTGNQPERAGINILNSLVKVGCNDIVGDGATRGAQETYGILNATSGGTSGNKSDYTCNTITGTYYGVFFEGTNSIDFRGTAFDDHHIGLLIGANGEIGQQDFRSNTWTGGAFEDAQIYSSNIVSSRFFIDPSIAGHEPNNRYTTMPSSWFIDGNGQSFDCASPQGCNNTAKSARPVAALPTLNLRDSSILNRAASTNLQTAVTNYYDQRRLYHKLHHYPNLMTRGGPFQQFLAQQQTMSAGQFYQVQQAAQARQQLAPSDRLYIDSCKQVCQYYLDTLQAIDSLLAIQYSSRLVSSRKQLGQQFSQSLRQQQAFWDGLQQRRQADIQTIKRLNTNVNATALYEQLEQQVNTIYWEAQAANTIQYSEAALQTLRKIASYCPQEGGIAVHQARGILAMVEKVRFIDFDCGDTFPKKEKESATIIDDASNWDITLYPNPTNGDLTVSSNVFLSRTSIIEVYNTMGQIVPVSITSQNSQGMTLDVSNLIDGIYILRVTNGSQTLSKSFTVTK